MNGDRNTRSDVSGESVHRRAQMWPSRPRLGYLLLAHSLLWYRRLRDVELHAQLRQADPAEPGELRHPFQPSHVGGFDRVGQADQLLVLRRRQRPRVAPGGEFAVPRPDRLRRPLVDQPQQLRLRKTRIGPPCGANCFSTARTTSVPGSMPSRAASSRTRASNRGGICSVMAIRCSRPSIPARPARCLPAAELSLQVESDVQTRSQRKGENSPPGAGMRSRRCWRRSAPPAACLTTPPACPIRTQ